MSGGGGRKSNQVVAQGPVALSPGEFFRLSRETGVADEASEFQTIENTDEIMALQADQGEFLPSRGGGSKVSSAEPRDRWLSHTHLSGKSGELFSAGPGARVVSSRGLERVAGVGATVQGVLGQDPLSPRAPYRALAGGLGREAVCEALAILTSRGEARRRVAKALELLGVLGRVDDPEAPDVAYRALLSGSKAARVVEALAGFMDRTTAERRVSAALAAIERETREYPKLPPGRTGGLLGGDS